MYTLLNFNKVYIVKRKHLISSNNQTNITNLNSLKWKKKESYSSKYTYVYLEL
jgi:hypothetical protein